MGDFGGGEDLQEFLTLGTCIEALYSHSSHSIDMCIVPEAFAKASASTPAMLSMLFYVLWELRGEFRVQLISSSNVKGNAFQIS